MTTPSRVDIEAWRNADYVETWTVAASIDANGVVINPVDITGWSAALQVRLYGLAGGSALISLTTVTTAVQGLRLIEPAAGQIEVRITKSSLEALPPAPKVGGSIAFSYDLVLTDPTGVKSVYATGNFTVNPGVTR